MSVPCLLIIELKKAAVDEYTRCSKKKPNFFYYASIASMRLVSLKVTVLSWVLLIYNLLYDEILSYIQDETQKASLWSIWRRVYYF